MLSGTGAPLVLLEHVLPQQGHLQPHGRARAQRRRPLRHARGQGGAQVRQAEPGILL